VKHLLFKNEFLKKRTKNKKEIIPHKLYVTIEKK